MFRLKFWTPYWWPMFKSKTFFFVIFGSQRIDLFTVKYGRQPNNDEICLSSKQMQIIYNYPPMGRWIVVDIYWEVKRRGINYIHHPSPTLTGIVVLVFTKSKTFLQFLLLKLSRKDAPFFSPFAKQWISKDIPSYGTQSKRAKLLSTDLVQCSKQHGMAWHGKPQQPTCKLCKFTEKSHCWMHWWKNQNLL